MLIPVIYYHLHQAYWTLRFNIFFSYSYSFPFPVNLIHIFTDGFLLLIHEAGHAFFMVFGNRILTIFAGSMLEVLLPTVIVVFCWFNRYLIWTQISLFILGTAWISVGYYAADGDGRQLPLLGGGGPEGHDWGNLLRHWNKTEYAWEIGFTFVVIGTVCYLMAIIVPIFLRTYEYVHIRLD